MGELFLYFFVVGAGLATGIGSIVGIGWMIVTKKRNKQGKKKFRAVV